MRSAQQGILAETPIAKAKILRDLELIRLQAGKAGHLRAETAHLIKQRFRLPVRRQRADAKAIGMQRGHLERLGANGARAANNTDRTHGFPFPERDFSGPAG